MDLALWEPSVRKLCARHGFGYGLVHSGIPGTFPTFIVEPVADGAHPEHGSIVVKFFGPLFDGADSFEIERAMGQFLTQQSLPVRSPAILAEGQLDAEWSYLIFEGVSGVSISQVRQQISKASWERVAEQMGDFIKGLHTITATTAPVISMPTSVMDWDGFVAYLETQRANCYTNHQGWNDLPARLLEQMQDYLLPVEELLDLTSPPHLIHADLTGDHLLGRLVPASRMPPIGSQSRPPARAGWESRAIIDWGDTRVGNILYELVALHLDLFQADKRLLRICLERYGMPDFYKLDFSRKAFSVVLLHQFPIPARVIKPLQGAKSLYELAEGLFGV